MTVLTVCILINNVLWAACQQKYKMKRRLKKLPKPTVALVKSFLKKWPTFENYANQEACLELLFKRVCPNNKNLKHVLLKITALNQFYSTNILDVFRVAKHIQKLDIDERLKAGDQNLVREIALVKLKHKKRNFYSFATKYCNHHHADKFPICDYFVEKMLINYNKKDGYALFKKSDLRDYPKFVSIIKSFRQHYGLGKFKLREIDIFLWLAGKKLFKRKYY